MHSGGADIHLYESGGQVVGSTAATLAGVTTANTVFSLAVDSSTGVVTLTQNQAIDHSTPGDTAAPYDTQLAALEQRSGDPECDGDDHRLRRRQGHIDAAFDTAHSTANFSGVFTVGASSYGADGAGTTATAYSLNLATGVLAGADSGLHSGGADIHLYESGGQVVGSTAATLAGVTTANTVFSLAVDSSTGVVTLTQNQAIDHSTPGDTAAPYDTQLAALSNGLVTLNATATITDSDGDKATSTQHVDLGGNIQFADDGPKAGDQSVTVGAGHGAGTNLLLIIDTSGSMGDDPHVSGYSTKLALEQDALKNLINEYGKHGDVMVQLVTFNTTASIPVSGWMTASDAIAKINGLSANGTTNYDDALLKAIDAYKTSGAISGGQNIAYFTSDGQPNVSSTWSGVTYTSHDPANAGIQPEEETAWMKFLNDNHIDSFALGLGSGTTTSALDPVAYDGIHAVDTSSIVVTDLSQLNSVLLDTVIVPDNVTGNLVTGTVPVSFGADGPAALKIVSIAHDANGDGIIDEVYDTHSAGYNAATTTLTLTTHEGGTLAVNFSTGDYTYTSPTTPSLGANEVFKYTVMDRGRRYGYGHFDGQPAGA